MNEYLYSPDVVRVTMVTGVIVSMLFYERLQLTTGGAIVPAYLALAWQAPATVGATLLIGYLTHLIVEKVITRRRILYGRRKFEVEVLTGLVLVGAALAIRVMVAEIGTFELAVATIGFLVPGILAHDMSRQGPRKTLLAVGATTAVLALFLFVYVAVLDALGAQVQPPEVLASVLGYDRRLLLAGVLASVLMGMLIFARFGLRSGGFVTAAYVALLLPRWPDLVFLLVTAVLTWLVVVKVLMPRLLLFGRRKLSTMVLFAALIGWSLEIALRMATHDLWQPGRGLTVMTLMVPALIANDAQRQGWERTGWGVSTATAGVFAVVNLLGAGLTSAGVLSAG